MFCRICGNELNDQAVICPKCGCAVNEKCFAKTKEKTRINFSGLKNCIAVLNYVSIVLILVTFLMWGLSIPTAFIEAQIQSFPLIYTYLYLGDTILVAFITSIVSFLTSITNFVFGLCNRKEKSPLVTNIVFMISVCILVLSVVSFALAW